MKWVLIAVYVWAGVTTSMMLAEIHHQACQPFRAYAVYAAAAAAWPLVGWIVMIEDHASSNCGAGE